ncbi:hypothetical protein [Pseudomonas sp. N040]|uniref:hypothetical protein n=1 Tax=Pseudomonas sp. N040 TaxID=2785325 RepID=UPI0018A2FFF7|nr:hypothetical protein [Pseudomonas sp. N040]MBF7730605.1 hypothetical protein [Pseudomonas sp. N040]MBW7014248.1 hypothetical protein [Pseudomonas sp. N040]
MPRLPAQFHDQQEPGPRCRSGWHTGSAGIKVTLFDFQKDALAKLRDALVSARKSVSPDNQKVIALSAATGSGNCLESI